MSSAFAGIEMGKRALAAHTEAMQTTGHNLANAGTEGYSRQRVEMKAAPPLDDPGLNRAWVPGQLGQGVETQSVTRVRDDLLENRINSTASGEGYWAQRDKYILQLEKIQNEPAEISIRSRMDKFWEGWQDLSLHPDEMASRKAVLERGQTLMDSIHDKNKNLTDVAVMINEDVANTVGEVNTYLKNIAALNVQIEKVKGMGDNPNDLLDQRDLLTNKLSSIVPITVENKRDPDEFQIHMNGVHLVQGKIASPMEITGDPTNEGYWKVIRSDTKEPIPLSLGGTSGGKLGALVELRDVDTRKEIQNLDQMTVHFSDLVNEVHSAGYGINGDTGKKFFTEYKAVTNADGSYDKNGDGVLDSTMLFRVTGKNALDPQQQVGLSGTMTLPGKAGNITLAYNAADTVHDIVQRINNSGSEVSARLDRDGKLQLKAVPSADPANPPFVLRHVEDSGQFLVGYSGVLAAPGPGGAYDWTTPQAATALAGGGTQYAVAPLAHPSAWVGINQELTADPGKLAAGLGANGKPAEAGDGSAALAIASLRGSQVNVGDAKTFDDYFAQSVASIGLKGETAQISLETQNKVMKDLHDLRDSVSGVNIDEEMSNLLKFQHGYNAAARFISNWNDMLDTIINKLGV
ncbi:MAG: flagellar hook-associated protein FlgK [Spirochaetales bacterium]